MQIFVCVYVYSCNRQQGYAPLTGEVKSIKLLIFTRIVLNCPIRYDSTQIGLRQSKYNGVDFLPIDL